MDGGGPFCGRLGTLDVWSNLSGLFRSTAGWLAACLLSCLPLLRQLLLERKTTGCSDRKRERGCGKL